jgi:hypothetical protein
MDDQATGKCVVPLSGADTLLETSITDRPVGDRAQMPIFYSVSNMVEITKGDFRQRLHL